MRTLKHFYDWLSEEKEENPSYQLLKLLRDEGENVDIRRVEELLQLGANPNYKMLGHSDEDYLDKIKDVAAKEDWGIKAPKMKVYKMASIVYPIFHKRPDVLDAMLEHGADPNLDISDVAMAFGSATPFMYAAMVSRKHDSDTLHSLYSLKDAGADVNVVDLNGNNIIHLAVKNQMFDMLEEFITEIRTSPFEKNRDGFIPYDLIDTMREYYINRMHVKGATIAHRYKDLLLHPKDPRRRN